MPKTFLVDFTQQPVDCDYMFGLLLQGNIGTRFGRSRA